MKLKEKVYGGHQHKLKIYQPKEKMRVKRKDSREEKRGLEAENKRKGELEQQENHIAQ